ncbi:MAG TPA: ATP-binding protein [Candidatus Limnocylindrales bacterium]|nr:ATP-binding protein [Candidatus Limnocylindrales bacterium]
MPATLRLAAADADSYPDSDAVRAYMLVQTRAILLSRASAVVWTILAAIVIFSAAKAWFEPATGYLWYGPALALALIQVVMLGLLRQHATTSRLEGVLLADTCAVCALIAWLGIAAGRTTGADFFLIGLAINTAAIVPWGPRSQAWLAMGAAAAIVGNAYVVNGALFGSLDFRTFVPAVVLIGASIYTSSMLESARLRSARADLLRERAEAETRELNATLEQRVVDRTAELRAANQELEAFAHSVSHDLRAPLRAMNGLSQALVEDHAESLHEDARDYLQRIRAEATRLGELIDDLLRLSRVTRTVMTRSDVDLSALVSEIAERLRTSRPDRDVVFTIAGGLHEHCDGPLVRVLLQNVLENAFKFSQKTPVARIEFGCEQHGRDRRYFVRDNGVGFEMKFVDKVFGAFERLHSSADFEGTGIGLATADRIVRRHGGMISAEGEPGKGATIRFTLCPAREDLS